jgi:hypothetical protein
MQSAATFSANVLSHRYEYVQHQTEKDKRSEHFAMAYRGTFMRIIKNLKKLPNIQDSGTYSDLENFYCTVSTSEGHEKCRCFCPLPPTQIRIATDGKNNSTSHGL